MLLRAMVAAILHGAMAVSGAVIGGCEARADSTAPVEVQRGADLPSECEQGDIALEQEGSGVWRCRDGLWIPAGLPACRVLEERDSVRAPGSGCYDPLLKAVVLRNRRGARRDTILRDSRAIAALRIDEVASGREPTMGVRGHGRAVVAAVEGRYVARIGHRGRELYRGLDAGAAIQAAIDSVSSRGGTVLLRPGTYEYQTVVPAFAPRLPRWVVVTGHGAVLRLSPDAPRAFDVKRESLRDTYRFIWLEGFEVDAGGLGGSHHTIFGNRVADVETSRAGATFDNIVIREVRAFNVFTSANGLVDARAGIAFEVARGPYADDIAIGVSNLLLDRIRLEGGNSGVLITGQKTTAEEQHLLRIDNVRIQNCSHELSGFPGRFFASSNFHVGQHAMVGFVFLQGNAGRFSGDNGIEVNNFETAVVVDNTMRDQVNMGYYVTNYNPGVASQEQRGVFARNRSEVTASHSLGEFGRGFVVATDGRPMVGTVFLLDSAYSSEAQGNVHGSALALWGRIAEVQVRSFSARFDVTYEKRETAWHDPIFVQMSSAEPSSRLLLQDVKLRYSARIDNDAVDAGASLFPYLVYVSGEDLDLEIDSMELDVVTRGFQPEGAGHLTGIYFGESPGFESGTARMRGVVSGIVLTLDSDDQDAIGMRFGTPLSADSRFQFTECDVSSIPDPARRVVVDRLVGPPPGLSCLGGLPLSDDCVRGYW